MFYYVFISVTHCCGIVLPKRYVKISKIINAKEDRKEKENKYESKLPRDQCDYMKTKI